MINPVSNKFLSLPDDLIRGFIRPHISKKDARQLGWTNRECYDRILNIENEYSKNSWKKSLQQFSNFLSKINQHHELKGKIEKIIGEIVFQEKKLQEESRKEHLSFKNSSFFDIIYDEHNLKLNLAKDCVNLNKKEIQLVNEWLHEENKAIKEAPDAINIIKEIESSLKFLNKSKSLNYYISKIDYLSNHLNFLIKGDLAKVLEATDLILKIQETVEKREDKVDPELSKAISFFLSQIIPSLSLTLLKRKRGKITHSENGKIYSNYRTSVSYANYLKRRSHIALMVQIYFLKEILRLWDETTDFDTLSDQMRGIEDLFKKGEIGDKDREELFAQVLMAYAKLHNLGGMVLEEVKQIRKPKESSDKKWTFPPEFCEKCAKDLLNKRFIREHVKERAVRRMFSDSTLYFFNDIERDLIISGMTQALANEGDINGALGAVVTIKDNSIAKKAWSSVVSNMIKKEGIEYAILMLTKCSKDFSKTSCDNPNIDGLTSALKRAKFPFEVWHTQIAIALAKLGDCTRALSYLSEMRDENNISRLASEVIVAAKKGEEHYFSDLMPLLIKEHKDVAYSTFALHCLEGSEAADNLNEIENLSLFQETSEKIASYIVNFIPAKNLSEIIEDSVFFINSIVRERKYIVACVFGTAILSKKNFHDDWKTVVDQIASCLPEEDIERFSIKMSVFLAKNI